MLQKIKRKISISAVIVGLILSIFTSYCIYSHLSKELKYFVYLLIILSIALTIYLVNRLQEKYREKASIMAFVIELILSIIVGNIVIKSYVISIFPIAKNASFIVAALIWLGWSIIGCGIIYLITHLLSLISWKASPISRQGFKQYLLYCLPSFIILGIIFAIYYPGTGTIDTTWLWKLIHENKFSDTHPLMLMVYYKLLTLVWDSYGVIALFQYLITVLTFGYAVNYFSSKGLKKIWCYVTATILPLYPVCAMYTVTLWKDIPYSMFLLIFLIMTIKVLEDDYLNKPINMIKYTAIGLTVMFFRHNGFIAIIGTGGLVFIYALCKKNYKIVRKTLIIGVCLVALFIGIKNFTKVAINKIVEGEKAAQVDASKVENAEEFYENEGYTQVTLMPHYVPTIIAVQQLIYTQHYSGDEFTAVQTTNFEKYVYLEELEQHKEQYFFGTKYGSNWEFYHKPNLTQKPMKDEDRPEFWRYYREIFAQHPVTMLDAYQKQIGIIWASVGYGPTPFRAYYKDEMLACCSDGYLEFVTPIKEYLDNNVFYVYNGIFIALIRPASFLMGILILCFIGFKRHKFKFLISMSPVFMNALAYMFVISSQDVRYFYINFIALPFALLYALMVDKKEETKTEVPS